MRVLQLRPKYRSVQGQGMTQNVPAGEKSEHLFQKRGKISPAGRLRQYSTQGSQRCTASCTAKERGQKGWVCNQTYTCYRRQVVSHSSHFAKVSFFEAVRALRNANY
jgi:hypothetical protein